MRAIGIAVVLRRWRCGWPPACALRAGRRARRRRAVVIYPGDVIGDDMLADLPAGRRRRRRRRSPRSRSAVVGKMARRTLLPGQAIPLAALDNPRLVSNGARGASSIYVDGGLTIVTTGAALQDGAVGDVIKVRNERQRRHGHGPRAAPTARCW